MNHTPDMKSTHPLPTVGKEPRTRSFTWVAITLLSAAAGGLAVWQSNTAQDLQALRATTSGLGQDVNLATAHLEETRARLGKAEAALADTDARQAAAKSAAQHSLPVSHGQAASSARTRRAADPAPQLQAREEPEGFLAAPTVLVIVR